MFFDAVHRDFGLTATGARTMNAKVFEKTFKILPWRVYSDKPSTKQSHPSEFSAMCGSGVFSFGKAVKHGNSLLPLWRIQCAHCYYIYIYSTCEAPKFICHKTPATRSKVFKTTRTPQKPIFRRRALPEQSCSAILTENTGYARMQSQRTKHTHRAIVKCRAPNSGFVQRHRRVVDGQVLLYIRSSAQFRIYGTSETNFPHCLRWAQSKRALAGWEIG